MKKSQLHKVIFFLKEVGVRLLIFVITFVSVFSGWTNVPFFKVEKAHAASGDFAIYRESAALDTLDGGDTIFSHDWDTTVATSSSITLNVDNTQIELGDTGHYLVMYNTRYDSYSGSYRSAVNNMMVLNDATTSIGWAQGYTRRSNGDNEVMVSGGGIIEVATASDPLVIKSIRADDNAAGLQRAADVSGVQVLKLRDAWDYIRLSKTSTQTGPVSASSWTTVTYDRQDEYDSDTFTHSTSTNSGDITLKEVGHYLVFVNTFGAIPTASTDRSLITQKLTLDGTDVDGSYTTVYIRGNNNSENQYDGATSVGMIIETSSVNQVLNVKLTRPDGTDAFTINHDRAGNYIDATAITIVKIPDSARYIRLDDTGTDDMNPSSLSSMGWDTEDEKDSAFTHSTSVNDSRIEVNNDGDYLFFNTLYATAAGVARAKTNQGWTKNGTTSMIQYGQTGRYNRNSGANDLGNWSGIIIPDLVDGDYIEVNSVQLGATGAVGADIKGVQGVELTSLFALSPSTNQKHFRWRNDSTALNTSGGWLANEDTSITSMIKNTTYRLRLEVANVGEASENAARKYELQYGEKNTTCGAITSWVDTGSSTSVFEMADTTHISPDGASTTIGLLANSEGYTRINGEGRDVLDTTGNIGPMASSTYVELEYSFKATLNAVTGQNYCFRVYDVAAGTALDVYNTYPETTILSTDAADTVITEWGTKSSVDDTGWTTISFDGFYENPVFVCSVNYNNNVGNESDGDADSVLCRVQNVSATSSQVRLQNSSSTQSVARAETIHWIVMEEGVYDTGDLKAEAFTYLSTVTDASTVFNGEEQSYSQTYSNPVVLGQVMSYNDTDWSVFYARGATQTAVPDSSTLYTGKNVGQDTDKTRNNETIGVIIFEQSNDSLDGVVYESRLQGQTIERIDDSTATSYSFNQSFSSTPSVAIISQAGISGADGPFPVLYGSGALTTTNINLAIMEDEISDGEMSGNTEAVPYVVFESAGSYATGTVSIDQTTYRFYTNADSVQPGSALAAENTKITDVENSDVLRLRTALQVGVNSLIASTTKFKLQYGEKTTSCNAISNWFDVASTSSSTAIWRGYDNATATSGSAITSSLLNSQNNVLQTYEEYNGEATNTKTILDGERGEWDWVIQANQTTIDTTYCFRIINANGNELIYSTYPEVNTITPAELTQTHYHWRDDSGTETTASSLTSGVEDTVLSNVKQEDTIRLRMQVSNEGGLIASSTKFRLEYGEKTSTCSDISSWERVWAVGGAWDPSDSSNLTQGGDTTNISVANGGVSDENTTFLTPNGGVRDTSDETGLLDIADDEFVELEFGLEATNDAVHNTTYCFRVSNNGTALPVYDVYPEATFSVHLEATSTGSHTSFIDIPNTSVYTGGAFVIQDRGIEDTHTITSVTITETGTVDASTDLDNIKLYYDLDTSAPYDCASESYDGTESQFGSTDTDGFSSANGVSTFTGSLQASSTQSICLYPVMDVLSSANNSDTISLQITVPSTDIVDGGGDAVRPSSVVSISGSSYLRDDVLTQIHYHWRNDDGNEIGATSATGLEDFPILAVAKGVAKRIRFEVSNEGATSSVPIQYRLEYGEKVSSCSDISTWTDVGATGGKWDMYDTSNLTDGNDITNIATSSGGTTDENTTFLTPNGAVKDTSSQTGNITLTESEFVELEYSLVASTSAVDGQTYCFRLTDAGTPISTYSVYPETTISPDVTVFQTGSQVTNLDATTTDNYVGGAFTITDLTGSRNVTSVTITETGTVDASTDLDNIKLYYDLDTSSPYDCASESYDGTESQFGSTDTDGFSSANGVSTFTDTVGISTTSTMCLYTVIDISENISNGETLDIQITDPSSEVVTSEGVVVPGTPVELSGSTNLRDSTLTQIHYHWRKDDGNEVGASSLTSGVEDTAYTDLGRGVTTRLRFQVSNEGATSSVPIQYRLEYGEKVSSCSDISTWTDVGAIGGDFDIINSAYFADGGDTTDIAISSGGTTNENTTFLTPNGGLKDTSSQTGNITLTESEFVELEYSLVASTSVSAGTDYCFRLTDAGVAKFTYDKYPEATITTDVVVSSTGTQTANIDIPSTNINIGGAFVIVDEVSEHAVTNITLTASGTVDASTDLDNIKLYYDLDTSSPYDCASESYDGTESQFGSTDTDGFSSATGTVSFTDSVNVNLTSTMCLYTVLDVTQKASNADVFDLYIKDPSTDVVLSVGSVTPTTTVAISGVTTLRDDVLTQTHYHWRDDSGTETTASSLTSGVEDTAITNTTKNDIYRLRLQVSNEGATSSADTALRLEYGKKITTCGDISTWTDVGDTGGDFDMTDSTNLTEGNNTTNIATTTGGVTDENSSFITSNSAIKDTSSQVSTTTFTESQFIETEFSISATDNADYEATYCFRLTNAGTPLAAYDNYAQMTIRENKDFNVTRGVETISGTSTTLYEGVDYDLQGGSTTAFIRITNSQHTGAGNDSVGAPDDIDNFVAYLLDPENIETSVTIARPATATLNTRVAWEVVEYIGPKGGDNEMVVRSQSVTTYGASNLSATTSSITVTDDSDVVVFITGQGNPNTNRTTLNQSLSTAFWHSTSSVAVFDRGASGTAVEVSWAVVEFTGINWKIQRKEHNYTAAGSFETETINTVNDLSRTFLHDQKRTAQNGLDETGHEVYLSSTGQVSFQLQSGATSPSTHYSVVWIVENTQTTGKPMVVTRSSGTRPNSGTNNETYNASIGKTLDDLSVASLFINNRSTGSGDYMPRPILAARLISTSQYEIWRSDVGQSQAYRTEIVEWPTAERTISQNYYRFYVDNDSLDPTDPWPAGTTNLGENTSITANDKPPQIGDLVRIRMSLSVTGATLPLGAKAFKLQYGLRDTTCSALTSEWRDVAPISSSTAEWRGFNGTSTSDGTNLSGNPPTAGDLNLSVSDRAGTYEEENNSTTNPYAVSTGEDVEYDWLIQRNAGVDQGTYCFRMVESDGVPVDAYTYYPTITTAGYEAQSQNWRWYDDEENITPSTPLEAENTSPIDIDFENAIKLRLTLHEIAGASGVSQKFKLQYSTQSDFSSDVNDVVATSSCLANSVWCYYDGAGVDNAKIASSTLSDADSCVAGVGDGCGTHNEAATTTSSYTHPAYSAAEHEFTIQQAGAEENVTYYFRAYDVTNDEEVALGSGKSYPSLSTKGATLSFTLLGLPAGTTTEGIITDVTTYATSVSFGDLTVGSDIEAAQRLIITTNAPKGYQVFMYGRQEFLSSKSKIEAITSTNEAPSGWSTACSALAKSCFGYHTGDDTLDGGSGRFAADNTYAKISTSSEEIAYSSFPVNNDTVDMVYKIKVTEDQEAGFYEHGVVYIIVPRF